ncbi:expressed protein [Phakopsora pachyrhizi]|uniref:Expressed protein n=1 Tax=Phakopsora pachyrhizi TaxID=170000 RepID=A0AAV0AG24_PHAPC|nr:expressed protein [Phakopsora pachyrhizi]
MATPGRPCPDSLTFFRNFFNILLAILIALLCPVNCYIPAQPSNDSLMLNSVGGSPNHTVNPNWIIQLNWQPKGIFSDGVNLQIKSDRSNDSLHQGVLLHFTEANSTSQLPASVPWIAMINCDSNSTSSSNQDDIFTLARDHGAQAAMIYSLNSQTCKVNQEFLDKFEKPLDVFSSGNLQGSRLIESQFSNILGSGYWFQSDLLNSSASSILNQISSTGFSYNSPSNSSVNSSPTLFNSQTNDSGSNNTSNSLVRLAKRRPNVVNSDVDSLESSLEARQTRSIRKRFMFSPSRLVARSITNREKSLHPFNINVVSNRSPGLLHSTDSGQPVFLVATLADSQVTFGPNQQVPNDSNVRSTQNRSGGSSTSLAMVILYAITGFVTLMFLIVIVSGAIRALRNPERYGPRPAGRRYNPETGEEDPRMAAPQTRAAGLTKAILDTFPVVKFGKSNNQEKGVSDAETNWIARNGDAKGGLIEQESMVMQERKRSNLTIDTRNEKHCVDGKKEQNEVEEDNRSISSSQFMAEEYLLSSKKTGTMLLSPGENSGKISHQNSQDSSEQTLLASNTHQDPFDLQDTEKLNNDEDQSSKVVRDDEDMANLMTCPICVCDFEDGDDIRVLPCDARHQFHKECVDPWLLNESRLCPLCRWDLSTRKDGTKILDDDENTTDLEPDQGDRSSQNNDLSSRILLGNRPSQLSLGLGRSQRLGGRATPTNSQTSDRSTYTSRFERPSGEDEQARTGWITRFLRDDGSGVTEGQGSRHRFLKYIDQVRKNRNQATTRRR